MSLPWMPFHVSRYQSKTGHLSALEHGIYLLLLMHYWQTGGLPDDDTQLARIARLTPTEWKRSKPVIEKFFQPGWKQGTMEEELEKAAKISSKRRAAAEQMHSNRHANAHANAEQMQTQEHLQQPSHLQEKLISNFSKVGSRKANGWTPPRHGATSSKVGRVYIEHGTAEWKDYAADYRSVHGHEPVPNAHGGKWFKTLGEAAA